MAATVLIVYYSRSGNTKKMADFVAQGAASQGVEVELKEVTETTIDDLLAADGIIMGSPTYYGTMAWEMKKLIDDSVRYHGKLKGKVGGAFSSSANIGGGNETTILDLLYAMLIHGMIVQGNPKGDHYGPVSIGEPDDRASSQCQELGANIALLTRKIKGE